MAAAAHWPVKQEDLNLWGTLPAQIETVEERSFSKATFTARFIWTSNWKTVEGIRYNPCASHFTVYNMSPLSLFILIIGLLVGGGYCLHVKETASDRFKTCPGSAGIICTL